MLLHWAPLTVPPARAKDLQRELSEVLARYTGTTDTTDITDRAGTGAPTHLLGLFLTPLGR